MPVVVPTRMLETHFSVRLFGKPSRILAQLLKAGDKYYVSVHVYSSTIINSAHPDTPTSLSAMFVYEGVPEGPAIRSWLEANLSSVEDALIHSMQDWPTEVLEGLRNQYRDSLMDLDDKILLAIQTPTSKTSSRKTPEQEQWAHDLMYELFPMREGFEVSLDSIWDDWEGVMNFDFVISKTDAQNQSSAFVAVTLLKSEEQVSIQLVGKVGLKDYSKLTDPKIVKLRQQREQLVEDMEDRLLMTGWSPKNSDMVEFNKRAAFKKKVLKVESLAPIQMNHMEDYAEEANKAYRKYGLCIGGAQKQMNLFGKPVVTTFDYRCIGDVYGEPIYFNSAVCVTVKAETLLGNPHPKRDTYLSTWFTFALENASEFPELVSKVVTRDSGDLLAEFVDIPANLIEEGILDRLAELPQISKDSLKKESPDLTDLDDRLLLALSEYGNHKQAAVESDAEKGGKVDWAWWGHRLYLRGFDSEKKVREFFFDYLQHLDRQSSAVLFGQNGEEKNRMMAESAPIYWRGPLCYIGIPELKMRNTTVDRVLFDRIVPVFGKVEADPHEPGWYNLPLKVEFSRLFPLHFPPIGAKEIKFNVRVQLQQVPRGLYDVLSHLPASEVENAILGQLAKWPEKIKKPIREYLKQMPDRYNDIDDEILATLYRHASAKTAANRQYPMTLFGRKVTVVYDPETGNGFVGTTSLMGLKGTQLTFNAPLGGSVPSTLANSKKWIERQLVRNLIVLEDEFKQPLKDQYRELMDSGNDGDVPDDLVAALFSSTPPAMHVEACFAMKADKWGDYIQGEYWLYEDGTSDYADGDVGEQGHEGIAAERIFSNFSSELEEEMIKFLQWVKGNPDDAADEGYALSDYASCMKNLDPETFTPPHDDWSMMLFSSPHIPHSVAVKVFGETGWKELTEDIKLFFMKHFRACHVINRNFSVWTLNQKQLHAIQSFLMEASEEAPQGEILIEEFGKRRHTKVPVSEFLTYDHPHEVFRGVPAGEER